MGKDSVDKLLEQWRQERPELDVSGLGLVVRVELLSKLLQRATAERLASVDMKPWEYDVLSALRRQGPPYELPATELARESLLTSGAMTTRVDQLEDQGLVRRSPDPDDRRGVRITLTDDGLLLIDEAIGARLGAADSCVQELSLKERRAIENGLRKLILSLDRSATCG